MGIKTAKAFYVTSAYGSVNTRGDRVRQGSGSTTDRQQRSDSVGELTAIPSARPASSETGLRAPRAAEGAGVVVGVVFWVNLFCRPSVIANTRKMTRLGAEGEWVGGGKNNQ